MRNQKPSVLAAALLLLLPFAAPSLRAQVQRSGGESQKIMQQYQQVAAEKTALQAQLAQMKKDLDAANSELAAVKKERDAAKAHVGVSPAALAQAQSAKQSAEDSAERSKKQVAELVGRFREVATNLRDTEADRSKLRDEAVKRSAAYDRCVQDNVQLYAIGRDVLDRYEHVGLFTRASASEPFTQLTRTRIENLVDEYRERAQQLQLSKPTP
jgi:chromosome segregation ATPase